jgi:hypothetical protein
MVTHSHAKPLKGLLPYERAKIERDFGRTVAGRVPPFPERLKLEIQREDGPVDIHLSKLSCSCIAVIHPSFVESLERTELDAVLSWGGDAQAELDALLARAERGEHVEARDVVIAREAVELEAVRQAAEDRQRAELVENITRESQAALAETIAAELSAGRAHVQALQNGAYTAMLELLDAAEAHNEHVATATERLQQAGISEPQRRGLGRTTELLTGDTVQPWWPVQDWAAGLLAAVHERHRLLGNSRWDRAELPRVFPSGPRPETD